MKPVLYNGLTLDFLPVNPMKKPSAFFNLSLKYGIPGLSGKMEDRDWMSTENAALTHFSTHDNDVRELFFLDACGGVSFPLVGFLLLKPFINVSSMSFRFSGMDGSGIYARRLGGGKYAPINDDPVEQPFFGKVINYTQEWMYIAPGFSLGFSFLNVFLAELSFQISPFISCGDLDEHLTANPSTQYKDLMWGGLLLESGFQFSYSPIQWLEFSAVFFWRNIDGTKGQTYRRNPIGTGIYQPEGTAGAGLSILDTGLCLKVRL
jgi:outer membrane protease